MSRLADNLAALREAEYRKLFLGQATSVVGVMFTVVALPFAVLEIGGTATDIGIVEAANLVPLAVFLLIGGVWADRLPRQQVMLVADFLRFGAAVRSPRRCSSPASPRCGTWRCSRWAWASARRSSARPPSASCRRW